MPIRSPAWRQQHGDGDAAPYLNARSEPTCPATGDTRPGALAEAVFTGNEVAGSCANGPLPTFQTLRVTLPADTESEAISAWLPAVGTYLPDCGEITLSQVVPSSDVYNLQPS
jgi:hypothetical protein